MPTLSQLNERILRLKQNLDNERAKDDPTPTDLRIRYMLEGNIEALAWIIAQTKAEVLAAQAETVLSMHNCKHPKGMAVNGVCLDCGEDLTP